MRSAGEGISAEDNGPNAMFKLSALKGTQAAAQVGETAVPDEEDAAAEPASSEDDDSAGASDEDSDEAGRWVCLVLLARTCRTAHSGVVPAGATMQELLRACLIDSASMPNRVRAKAIEA